MVPPRAPTPAAPIHSEYDPPRRGATPARPEWVALLLLGVGVTLLAAFGYWRTIERLDQGVPLRFKRLSLGVVSALGLAVLGLAMALYLAFGLNEPH